MKKLLVSILRIYQLSRPLRPQACRFYPSCSDYAIGSIQKFGALKGSTLAAYRLCRCQPLSDGGIDEVPEDFAKPFKQLQQKLAAAFSLLRAAAKCDASIANKRS